MAVIGSVVNPHRKNKVADADSGEGIQKFVS
jgi:hypothetical protein